MAHAADRTLVVASFAPRTNGEALARAAEVPAGARGVEIRLDGMEETPDLGAMRRAFAGKVLLATIRSVEEGGGGRADEAERARVLAAALVAGFDLADVEAFRPGGDRLLGLPPGKVVASFHLPANVADVADVVDVAGVPANLPGLLRRLAEGAPAHAKLVASPRDSSGALALLEAQASAGGNGGRGATGFAVFGMGEAGIATRALSPYLGASLSFGAFDAPSATAPGQLPVDELVQVYGVGRRGGVEGICALFGGVVSHSLSPALHNGNFEAGGDPLLYVPFALRSLEEELPSLAARLARLGLPLRGASVTIPFKDEAARIGGGGLPAANTLLPSGTGWRSENTDRDAFDALVPPAAAGERALVLGAGGTARTAVEALLARGYRVTIAARTRARAEALARSTGAADEVVDVIDVAGVADVADVAGVVPQVASFSGAHPFALLVNATPLGLRAGDPLPCPEGVLRPPLLVVDAPYRPGGTPLARLARARGLRLVDGFTLLAAWAARQATLFTSRPATAAGLVGSLPASRRGSLEVTP